MPRRKQFYVHEVRIELLTALIARGYSIQSLRKQGPNPDDDVAGLFYRAYTIIGSQEEKLTNLGIQLTLADAGHRPTKRKPK